MFTLFLKMSNSLISVTYKLETICPLSSPNLKGVHSHISIDVMETEMEVVRLFQQLCLLGGVTEIISVNSIFGSGFFSRKFRKFIVIEFICEKDVISKVSIIFILYGTINKS